jgi:acetylornithine deacetylase/succinyl-diaminopimelate desuccinylase-like protein
VRPIWCVATFDRRFLSEQPFETVKAEVEQVLSDITGEHPGLRCELRDRMVVHPV